MTSKAKTRKNRKIKTVLRSVKFPKSKKNMCVPNNKETKKSAVVRAHLKSGRWESHISKLLDEYTIPNTNAIDIGAFIGTHTLTLSDSVKNGTVYSFEPQPWAYNAIKCSLNENEIKNVVLKNVGISDKKDMIKFCSDSTGGSTICHEKKKKISKWKYVYNIDILSIDSMKLKNISIIKIDVEGHELKVLNGAKDTIKRNKPTIIIEVWNKKDKRNEFKKMMKNMNYKVSHISGDDFLCTPK
jgi:FkbM family methyltransferase